jgi:GLPGLI family protein
MQKILLTLIILIIGSETLLSQTLDSAYFQCLYKLEYAKDSLAFERRRTDEMLLLVGNKVSAFFSYRQYLSDSLQKANPEMYKPQVIRNADGTGSVTPALKPTRTSENKEFLYLTPSEGKLFCLSKIWSNYFMYEDNLRPPAWHISTDTARILNYTCNKAATTYKGREWTAWFTYDIPVPEGPWLLRGLPGIILKAYDKNEDYIFECTGIERLKLKKPIVKDEEHEYRLVSKKDYMKEEAKFYDDPLKYFGARTAFDTQTIIRKINPIELGE